MAVPQGWLQVLSPPTVPSGRYSLCNVLIYTGLMVIEFLIRFSGLVTNGDVRDQLLGLLAARGAADDEREGTRQGI